MPRSDETPPRAPPATLEISGMHVAHPFDVSLVVRGRRRQLKLRQIEVARAAGVSREWLIEFERGKRNLDFDRVLKTLAALNIQLKVFFGGEPPAWSKPLTKAATERERRIESERPPSRRRPRIERPAPKAPADWV